VHRVLVVSPHVLLQQRAVRLDLLALAPPLGTHLAQYLLLLHARDAEAHERRVRLVPPGMAAMSEWPMALVAPSAASPSATSPAAASTATAAGKPAAGAMSLVCCSCIRLYRQVSKKEGRWPARSCDRPRDMHSRTGALGSGTLAQPQAARAARRAWLKPQGGGHGTWQDDTYSPQVARLRSRRVGSTSATHWRLWATPSWAAHRWWGSRCPPRMGDGYHREEANKIISLEQALLCPLRMAPHPAGTGSARPD